ncbi:MAG TPA: sugar ABC transporter permease [Symbiobacteriaceae bacterium]|nr:sugar ABC transporter permease [Symbiobacteriaceae bacterium]
MPEVTVKPATKPRTSAPVRLTRLPDWTEPLLYLSPSLAILTLFVFYPTVRSIYLSLYLTNPLGKPKVFVGAEHFVNALTSGDFLHSLGVSVTYVLYTVPVGILLALGLALLAHRPLRGIKIFQLIFSSPLCISVATGATVFLMMYNPISGILNYFLTLLGLPRVNWLTDPTYALWAVGFVSIWMRLGFNFVLLLSGLQNVPQELYEAAVVDGAGPWAKTRHVTLPMLSPTIFFAAVVGVIHAFQAFGEIDIMTSGGPAEATNVVVYQIYQEAFQKFEFGAASSQALILFAVILVLTYFQFKLGERRVHYQ